MTEVLHRVVHPRMPVSGEFVPTNGGGLAASGGLTAFTEAWLANRRLSEHTRAAYRRDVAAFLSWCASRHVDPLRATFLHVNTYARDLESTVDSRSGRVLTPATVARRLSGLSSWYAFLVKVGAVPANPVAGADRPRIGRDHSGTVGLTGRTRPRSGGAAQPGRPDPARRPRAAGG